MSPDATLAAIMAAPLILLMVLRVNATLVFLSLCLGSVLIEFVADDANSFFDLFNVHASKVTHADNNTIKIFLLVLPVVLTTIFMIRTVNGHGRLALNLLPSIGVGLLGALLLVPLLPAGLSHNIVRSDLWDQVQKAQTLIVGASALICLLVLWLQRPKTGEGKHKKH
jgi:hypothetical protein